MPVEKTSHCCNTTRILLILTRNSISRFARNKDTYYHFLDTLKTSIMKYTWIAGITLSLLGFSACNDETLEIGKTLTTDYDKFNVSTADYQVSTQTILADSVLLRNNASYLGRMKDPETCAYITGEFMTQLHILEGFNIVSQDSVLGRYEGLAAADSCEIRLYMDKPTADIDTLAAMKIRMNELNNPMDESMRYYSN